MKKLNAEYDYVVIVDCLSDNERDEYDDSRHLARYLADKRIENKIYYCANKVSVLEQLRRLTIDEHKGKKFPIVFISHGKSLSLFVKHKSEDIEWHELRQPLLDINSGMGGDLFVLMACCYGFSGYKIDQRDSEDTTFFGIIGPETPISPTESMCANFIFFKGLIEGEEIPKCVEKMNACLGRDVYRSLTTQDNKQA